jgi:multidrug resistance efflux pump
MNNLKMARVHKAQAKVDAARAAIAQDQAAVKAVQDQITALQAQITEMRKAHANKWLHTTLDAAERELAEAEEAAVEELNIALAAEIMRKQASDPLHHYKWIVEHVLKLRASVRSEMDTPINKKYQVHPLIMQALALQPKPDEMDTPIAELAGGLDCSWPRRRKALLAEAMAAA